MFYAHSLPDCDKSHWQTLPDHLLAVGRLARAHADIFGWGEIAEVAGCLHDLGKYTERFQARLSGGERVDHSTWGAVIAAKQYGSLGTLLAYGIAGHHTGLANGRNHENGTRTSLTERLCATDLPELCSDWQKEIPLPDALKLPSGFKACKSQAGFQRAFLGRMLFSCLVDSDFLDTEAYYRQALGQPAAQRGSQLSLTALRDRFNQHMAQFQNDRPINAIRADILAGVRSHAANPTGVFSLTVPTGGGKTLASLAFALDHAIANGLRRIIFVIPFTSIVEQTAGVFRNAFGDLGAAAVLEHHSAFADDRTQSHESRDKLKLAMENWDYPIIVTTSVQFFESLYADRPARCRKLHNIAGSVVILDEAQILPLKLLRPCVSALAELARNYRSSIVLCTATQPALHGAEFEGGFEHVTELAPDPPRLFQMLERVTVAHIGEQDDAGLLAQMQGSEQVLCIVNNRRHARALFEGVAALPGARHLTTLMCAKHRSAVLNDIRRDLREGRPCRLVATSLIEAGVDVDFPKVLRAEAGLDSIAQAAGRCNREGKRNAVDSPVLIFRTNNPDWAPPPELLQFAQVAHDVLRKYADQPLSQAAIKTYFVELYWQKGVRELDAYDLLVVVEENELDGIPYEWLASKFRMIESVQLPVLIPFDEEARKALHELEFAEGCAEIGRRLQPYLVQIPRDIYIDLYQAGAIQAVQHARFGDQFMQLVNMDLYDSRFGISFGDPTVCKAERLVW